MLSKETRFFRKRKAAGHQHLSIHRKVTRTLKPNLVRARPKERACTSDWKETKLGSCFRAKLVDKYLKYRSKPILDFIAANRF